MKDGGLTETFAAGAHKLPDGRLLDPEPAPGFRDAKAAIVVDEPLGRNALQKALPFFALRGLRRKARRHPYHFVPAILEAILGGFVGVNEARIIGSIVRKDGERRALVEPSATRRRVDKVSARQLSKACNDQQVDFLRIMIRHQIRSPVAFCRCPNPTLEAAEQYWIRRQAIAAPGSSNPFCPITQVASPIKAAASRYRAMTSGVKWKVSRKLSVR